MHVSSNSRNAGAGERGDYTAPRIIGEIASSPARHERRAAEDEPLAARALLAHIAHHHLALPMCQRGHRDVNNNETATSRCAGGATRRQRCAPRGRGGMACWRHACGKPPAGEECQSRHESAASGIRRGRYERSCMRAVGVDVPCKMTHNNETHKNKPSTRGIRASTYRIKCWREAYHLAHEM